MDFWWIVSASSPKAENSCFGVWWLAIMDVLASGSVKRKTLNFRLPSVVQGSLCFSSLLSHIDTLFVTPFRMLSQVEIKEPHGFIC